MHKLKIGDKVIIRGDLEHKTYGLNTAVPDMLKYAGEEATIIGHARSKQDNYTLDIDGGCWTWDINMFEELTENGYKEHTYQIGDKVKVHDNLSIGTHGNVDFVMEMSTYLGMEATITDIDFDGDFSLDIDNGNYYWSKEMISPLEKVNTINYECEYFRLIEVVNEYEDIIDELEDELKESELNNMIITEKYNSLVHEYNNLLTLHTNSLVENAKLKKKTTI